MIRTEPFSASHAEEWDRFVDAGRNGTVFHQRSLLAYHPPDRFEDASLIFRDAQRMVSVFPAAWVHAPGIGRILQSHPGASYGGPVFARGARTDVVDAVVGALRSFAADAGADAIRMRLPPHVFHRPPLEELHFVLRFHGFSIFRTELSMFVQVRAESEEALLATLDSSCRRAVRKAWKSGLVAGESQDIPQFWEVLEDNLKRRYGLAPTHTLAEALRLRELIPDRVRLFVARDGERILAGTFVFLCNDDAAHTFYLASREEAQAFRPLNLAVFSAMDWLRQNGFSRLNFGVSTPNGESVNWGLLAFKESFGASGVSRDTYQLVLRDAVAGA
jgi:hypothetical protein